MQIEDAGSSNGTFVNGNRISSPTALANGDTVRVGQTELEAEVEEAKPAGTVIAGGPPQGTVVAPKSPGEPRPVDPAAAQPPAAGPGPAPTPSPGSAPLGPPPTFTSPLGQDPAPYSGAPQGPGYPTGPQYATPVKPKGMAPPGSGSSKGLVIGLIVGLVVLVAAALVFFLFLQPSDEDEIRETIETIAADPTDPDACDLVTQRFKEESSGQTGTAADDACRAATEDSTDQPEEVEIDNIEVDGETATADVTGEDGETVTIRLVEEDGTWKIDGSTV